MHHKRKRPKNRRAGCLLCKPWKANGYARTAEGGEKFSDHRRRVVVDDSIADVRRHQQPNVVDVQVAEIGGFHVINDEELNAVL